MKQADLIKMLRHAANENNLHLNIKQTRRGIHLATEKGGLRLSPDQRSDIDQRNASRCFKSLGLRTQSCS